MVDSGWWVVGGRWWMVEVKAKAKAKAKAEGGQHGVNIPVTAAHQVRITHGAETVRIAEADTGDRHICAVVTLAVQCTLEQLQGRNGTTRTD
jgi:hypothetical protein